MKELSLNILDIAQNSIKAEATVINIEVIESAVNNILSIKISDNGCGMDKDFLDKVCDPFVTTRTTRKVGLGIPLLKSSAEGCDGEFKISSQKNVGTEVFASFALNHLDRVPLGDMAQTIITLITFNEKIKYIYKHVTDKGEFIFDTEEIKKVLGDDISLNVPDVLNWINDYINENLSTIDGGKI